MSWLYVIAVTLVAHTVYSAARSGLVGAGYAIARTVRFRHVVANLPVLALTIAVAFALVQVPGFDTGWTNLLGGEGSIFAARTADSGPTLASFAIVAVVAVFLPALALLEERAFRTGSQWRTRRARLGRALVFGLAHMAAGVSLGVALALTVPGLWFTNRYLAGYAEATRQGAWSDEAATNGVVVATRAHLAWNATLFAVLLVSMTVTAFA